MMSEASTTADATLRPLADEASATLPAAISKRRGESGYAYLMALFMVLVVIVGTSAAVENVLTTGRRQREDEVIWRGNQYVRAIRLFYKKTGHYPQNLEDLEKGQPQLHFLRYAAYKDPLNKSDGAWRLIYVNAAGQIIGSVRYATLQQMALLDLNGGCAQPNGLPGAPGTQPGLGTPASSIASSSSGSGTTANGSATGNNTTSNCQPGQNAASPQGQQSSSSTSSQNQQNSFGAQPGSTTAQPGQNSSAGMQSNLTGASGQQLVNPLLALKPTGSVTGPVLGGFITGVGSTIDKKSLKVYKGGKKYNEWEFIWNPLEDQAAAMQQGLNPQTGQPGQPGQGIGGIGGIFGAIGGNGAAGANGAAPGTAPTTSPTPDPNAPSPPPQQPPQQ